MKKIISLLTLAILLVANGYSQDKKIEASLGTQLSFADGVDFGVYSYGGYKVTDDFVAGLKLGTAFVKNVSNFEVGTFGKYYFNNLFGMATIMYTRSKFKGEKIAGGFGDYEVESYSSGGVYASIEPGYKFNISDQLGVESGLNLNFPFYEGGKVWVGLRIGGVFQF